MMMIMIMMGGQNMDIVGYFKHSAAVADFLYKATNTGIPSCLLLHNFIHTLHTVTYVHPVICNERYANNYKPAVIK
jgi:hypothetical protein